MDKIKVVKTELRKVETVTQALSNEMMESFEAMSSLFKILEQDDAFKAQATRGFLEVMEIALEYHNDLMPLLAKQYEVYVDYYDNLTKLKDAHSYKEIES